MFLAEGKPHTMDRQSTVPEAQAPQTQQVNGTTNHGGGETMFNSLYSFIAMLQVRMHREEGQTMAEYGILLGVIALVVVGVAVLLGSSISALFSNVAGKV
jgi:pilus assembly protein Flp/PilA